MPGVVTQLDAVPVNGTTTPIRETEQQRGGKAPLIMAVRSNVQVEHSVLNLMSARATIQSQMVRPIVGVIRETPGDVLDRWAARRRDGNLSLVVWPAPARPAAAAPGILTRRMNASVGLMKGLGGGWQSAMLPPLTKP